MNKMTWRDAVMLIVIVSATAWILLILSWKAVSAEELSRGVGMVCNTPEQVEEVVALMSVGKEVEQVSTLINEKEGKNACGVLHVVFVKHDPVKTVKMNGERYDIVRVTLTLIVVHGQGFPAGNLEQYILLPHQGYDA